MARAVAKSKSKSIYCVHPTVAMIQKWVAELRETTGRSLDEWVSFVKNSGPPTEKARRQWLKEEHQLGTRSAGWIAEKAEGKTGRDSTPEEYLASAVRYVRDMFAGKKAALTPIYEELLNLAATLGDDVKACPCTTIVPLYRKHVFAQIKPTTNTRIDLGLALHDKKTPKRLIDTGGFEKKDRITRRIELTSARDIDDEVKRWLKTAYDLDA